MVSSQSEMKMRFDLGRVANIGWWIIFDGMLVTRVEFLLILIDLFRILIFLH